MVSVMPQHPFIHRWHNSGAAERANYALFLSELCDYLEVPRPDPAVADNTQNHYVFERPVTFRHPTGLTSTGFIDLYKHGCFVLEAKQGSAPPEPALLFEAPRRRGTAVRGTAGWDEAMLRARNQAEQYAKALPTAEGWPPFLIVVDVGYSIEIFVDFSGMGKAYVPFPDSLTTASLSMKSSSRPSAIACEHLARPAFSRSQQHLRTCYPRCRLAPRQPRPLA